MSDIKDKRYKKSFESLPSVLLEIIIGYACKSLIEWASMKRVDKYFKQCTAHRMAYENIKVRFFSSSFFYPIECQSIGHSIYITKSAHTSNGFLDRVVTQIPCIKDLTIIILAIDRGMASYIMDYIYNFHKLISLQIDNDRSEIDINMENFPSLQKLDIEQCLIKDNTAESITKYSKNLIELRLKWFSFALSESTLSALIESIPNVKLFWHTQ